MKKVFLWMLISLLALTSCENDLNESQEGSKATTVEFPNYPSVIKYSGSSNRPSTKAGVYKALKWEDYDIIRIHFMNGEPNIINKVKEVASQYTDLTNITFKYVEKAADSDVRIRFSYAGESPYEWVNWSYLGQEHLDLDTDQPTMNLVIADRGAYVNSDIFRGEILRNYGRMLGMVYEHTFKDNGMNIRLDYETVTDDFRFSNWDVDSDEGEIDVLFFAPAITTAKLYKDGVAPTFDENSIMLPHIPSYWIGSGTKPANLDKVVDKMNTQLSEQDKRYIESVYKKPEPEYKRGKVGNINISLAGTSKNWALVGWDYITNQSNARIINNYPTIGVGEYEWTTLNLRMHYENADAAGNQLGFINYDNKMVQYVAGNAFGNDANTIKKFEELFGTWVTENDNKEKWLYGVSYRDDKIFTRNDIKYLASNIAFDLPDAAAILQLLGQAPHTTGNIYTDFRNFAFGLPVGTNAQVAQALANEMPFLKTHNDNISGLNFLPLGSMHGHGNGYHGDIYTKIHLWCGDATAFIKTGEGIKLKMKGHNRNFNFYQTGTGKGIGVNEDLSHWGSVRYCRALTDEELGYRLYVDESSDRVVRLDLNEQPEAGYVELPRGLERGVALSYLCYDADYEVYYFTKSWSKIKQEALNIRYNIAIY